MVYMALWAMIACAVVLIGRYTNCDAIMGLGAIMVLMTCCFDV